MHADGRTPDPQWDFTLLVRAALETVGEYAIEVDTRDAQAVVDIRWAARQAGRLMGATVEVDLSSDDGHADSIVVATVRRIESDGPERLIAEEGLERLLASVLMAQGTTTHLPVEVPRPRRPLIATS
jgi:hypothetical protein